MRRQARRGADGRAMTTSHMTALQLTVAINNPAPCAESLVKAGADTSLKNEDGCTALDYAIQTGNLRAIRFLENVLAHNSPVAEMAPGTAPEVTPELTPETSNMSPEMAGVPSSTLAVAPMALEMPSEVGTEISQVSELSPQMRWLSSELEQENEVD